MGAQSISNPPLRARRDGDARQAMDCIRRIVQVLRLSGRRAEQRVGLSAAQLFVLQKLSDAAPLSLNGLAERTRTHQSSVSVVVQRLVDKGYVRRGRSATDRRRIVLRLTRAGRAVLNRAPIAAQDSLIGALERLGGPRLRRLTDLLEEVVRRTGLPRRPAAMFFEEEIHRPEP